MIVSWMLALPNNGRKWFRVRNLVAAETVYQKLVDYYLTHELSLDMFWDDGRIIFRVNSPDQIEGIGNILKEKVGQGLKVRLRIRPKINPTVAS